MNGLPDAALVAAIVALAGDPEAYETFRDAGRSCRWCREPVRLVGTRKTIDKTSGEIIESFSTGGLARGELYKACGTRRTSRCPSCAAIYRGDARQLVLSGLVGGKGVPESVAARPLVFATLTAPSFGAVHGALGGGGTCQPRGKTRCPHGRARSCFLVHDPGDPILGEAICAACYDYEGAVLFNAHVSELWRRTTIYARRELARSVGMRARDLDACARLSYAKVAEFQRRGVVHLHVIARLDGADDAEPPPSLTEELLGIALAAAAGEVQAPYPAGRGEARWGEQFDCREIVARSPEETARIANYLAKYATKGSDALGALDHRLRSAEEIASRNLPPQLRRMAETAWRLGEDPALSGLRLREWAHTLGLRAHFLTKSRRFSTTFMALREERQAFRFAERLERLQLLGDERADELVVLAEWTFTGRGWQSRADAYLARSEARRAVEARRLARGAEEPRPVTAP